MSGSGGSRVSIPNNVRKTIQDIKEITGNHSDDDIYGMLKECNMDPNETAQRLLYLDTFHEVKRKHDRRKLNVNSRVSEESRWTTGTAGQGARGGRGNYSSSYISLGAGGGRNVNARKENGVSNRMERGFRPSVSVPEKAENNADPRFTNNSAISVNRPTSVSDGCSSQERGSPSYAAVIGILHKDNSAVDANKVGTMPHLQTSVVKQTPSFTPTFVAEVGVERGKANSDSHPWTCSTSSSVSSVYSFASDPVRVPPLSSQVPGVGAIKCEVGQQIAAESGAINPAGNRSSTAHHVANNIQAALGDVSSTKTMLKETQIVEKNQPLEPSQTLSFTTSFGSLEVISIQDDRSSQKINGPSKVVASEAATLVVEAGSQSLPELNVSVLQEATSKLDMKLDKLNTFAHQPVIFPNHLQVPEDFKNGLTFGSLDATFVPSAKYVNGPDDRKGSMPTTESLKGNDKADKETSLSNPSVSSTGQGGDYPDNPYSPPHVQGNSSALKDSVSSGAAPKYNQSKQETMLPRGGPQYPFVPTAPNYGFPFIQPMTGSQLVQCEGPEPQSGNSLVSSTSGSTPTATQPSGVGQSSIAVSPPPFPLFRQPYPPNFFPFGPYFPPFYLASNAQQFSGHSGFPQQPSTGNVYLSPAAGAPAPGVKFTVPQSKPGLNAGNPTQIGNPSGYGVYNPSLAVTSGSSTGNGDLTASEMKENSVYTTVQQGEGPLVWFPAPGRDMSSLHANSFYNHLPQGQHVSFSPSQAGHAPFAGIYHPAQTMAATSTAHPLQQSQAISGSVEAVGPPSGAYQQPQHAINWNSNY